MNLKNKLNNHNFAYNKDDKIASKYLNQADYSVMDNNILKYNNRIVIPSHLYEYVCQINHGHILSGHFGIRKTLNKIKDKYFWFDMTKFITKYVKSCSIFQLHKRNYTSVAKLQPIWPQHPFNIVNIDIIGPLKTTQHGNRYVIVAIDHFSKYVIAKPLRNFDSEKTKNFIFNEIFCKYGNISSIITDQGFNFQSYLVHSYVKC